MSSMKPETLKDWASWVFRVTAIIIGTTIVWTWKTGEFYSNVQQSLKDNAAAVANLDKSVTEKFNITKEEVAKLSGVTDKVLDKLPELRETTLLEKARNDAQEKELEDLKGMLKETLRAIGRSGMPMMQPQSQTMRIPQ